MAAESVLAALGVLACSGAATVAAGAAGACATEANGKPRAAADKREMRSLFMGRMFLKVMCVLSHHLGFVELTRQNRLQVRARVAGLLEVQFGITRQRVRFAWR